MSNVDASTPNLTPPKRSRATSLLFGTVGVIAIFVGLSQMWGGMKQMFGWGDEAKVTALLKESEDILAAASKHLEEAEPPFTSLLNAVDASGVGQARVEHRDEADAASNHFADAAKGFALAAAKADEIMTLNIIAKLRTYLTEKSKAYRLVSSASEKNVEIIRLILDESIAAPEELNAKLVSLVEARTADEKSAVEISEAAEAAVKKE